MRQGAFQIARIRADIIAPLRLAMRLKVQLNPSVVNAASLFILLVLGWLDYITGYEFGFFIFYLIPVAMSAWFCGRGSGVMLSAASAACWYLSDKLTHHPYPRAYFIYWETFMRLVSFLTTALTISRIRELLLNDVRLNAELQRALKELEDIKRGQ